MAKAGLRIGFFVQRVASAPGYENNVSAHVQLPLKSMRLLSDAGHDVELITTEFGESLTLPSCLPKDIPLHTVPYGLGKRDELIMFEGPFRRIRAFRLIKQLRRLKRLAREREIDVYHFSGGDGVALLGGMLKMLGLKIPVVASLDCGRFSRRSPRWKRALWTRLSSVITATEHFGKVCKDAGLPVTLIRHGVAKEVEETSLKPADRRRVLFWRDPSWENGADLCRDAFAILAPEFPEVSFDFAVRAHWNPTAGLRELAEGHQNVNFWEFPYPAGISIENLISESICIVLPFRELSTNPQWAVMESLLSGVATVTTDIESNGELILDGISGRLIPSEDLGKLTQAVRGLLRDPISTVEMGRHGRQETMRKWNWEGYADQLSEVYRQAIK
ncbi:MAG TPA: glycosyltransferase family 4 protein [Verrucomicrobiales bacterium]|nr:glycosyltransferase family 4 protein [Verrucomicrobiales bacterium]